MGLYEDAVALSHRGFVGRKEEIARFQKLLDGSDASVWWVFGPGGIGKSQLLSVLANEAAAAGCGVTTADFRPGEATIRGLTGSILQAIESCGSPRAVVVLDAIDPTAAAERWLSCELLPQLPSGSLVLIGSRQAPSLDWRTTSAWSTLLELVPLRGLSPEEGHQLLELADVSPHLAPHAIELTHGHPLALQLFAETLSTSSNGSVPVALSDSPDLVAALLNRFVENVPDDQHRLAVEVASISRVTTRSLIRGICDDARADRLFDWLAAQPWVERLPTGLRPHDLARDVVTADLRTNDPDRFAAARHAVRAHVLDRARFQQDPERSAADYLYLHELGSVLRSAWHWSSFGQTDATEVRPGDRDAMADLVASAYGPESVGAFDHWLTHQPHGFTVLRELGEVIGFVAMVVFDEPRPEDLEADPSVAAIWSRALRRGRPRQGQTVGLFRFVCDKEAATLPPSPTYNAVSVLAMAYWMTMPSLSLDYIVKPRGGSFEPMMNYIDFHPAVDAEHVVGDTDMVVFEHDWREAPLPDWLDRMEQLEAGAAIPPSTDEAPVLVALDEEAFAKAVRAALSDLSKPARLADNPLIASRVVRDTSSEDLCDALVQTLKAAFSSLDHQPRTERARRALDRTYFRGAVTQETAAEVLDMAFSTYRRHLAKGIDLLVAQLWRWELYGRTD
ncbi:MAG: ATP-binding protein [Acidimicrobiales bacterium]